MVRNDPRANSPVARIDPGKHYFGCDYCSPSRLASFAYQISETLSIRPGLVLEIGPGNGVVSHLLRGAGLNVVTLDVESSLRPDLVASVLHLPVASGCFDLVLCCEVLEHLPYDRFPLALREMWRVTRRRVLLSLPDAGRCGRVGVLLPGLGDRRLLFGLPRLRAPMHVFDGQHYWEIGKAGYPLRQILKDVREAGFDVLRNFRVFEHPYHHVFVLEK